MPALSHAYFYKQTGQGIGYDAAAVQSISVTTQSPRNPLSSLGYKGVVGYIKQPNTADVTIEEFIPANVGIWIAANSAASAGGNPAKTTKKLSDVATADDANPAGVGIAGASGCVMTGVTFNFNAGQPARCTWTFLGKSGAANLDGGDAYSPLAGTGNEKTVLLWENVNLTADTLFFTGGTDFLSSHRPVSGVQSVTFTGTINKDTLYALGIAGVYQHVTTFPTNVTVAIESYELLTAVTSASGNIACGPAKAITCYQTSRGMNVAVGGFRTCTEQYTAADLEWYTV